MDCGWDGQSRTQEGAETRAPPPYIIHDSLRDQGGKKKRK